MYYLNIHIWGGFSDILMQNCILRVMFFHLVISVCRLRLITLISVDVEDLKVLAFIMQNINRY